MEYTPSDIYVQGNSGAWGNFRDGILILLIIVTVILMIGIPLYTGIKVSNHVSMLNKNDANFNIKK